MLHFFYFNNEIMYHPAKDGLSGVVIIYVNITAKEATLRE